MTLSAAPVILGTTATSNPKACSRVAAPRFKVMPHQFASPYRSSLADYGKSFSRFGEFASRRPSHPVVISTTSKGNGTRQGTPQTSPSLRSPVVRSQTVFQTCRHASKLGQRWRDLFDVSPTVQNPFPLYGQVTRHCDCLCAVADY